MTVFAECDDFEFALTALAPHPVNQRRLAEIARYTESIGPVALRQPNGC